MAGRSGLIGGGMTSNPPGKVLIIVGATAAGKTELTLALAELLNAEIISADSRLLYKGMNIGTAKPSKAECEKVNHHLIDVANPDETWSLGRFHKAVFNCIEQVLQKNKLPILVGGTGQYIRSLIEGWDIPAVEPHRELRNVLENWERQIGFLELHHKLAIVDPQSARSIEPQNKRRTIRALEVIFATGRRFSEARIKTGPKFDYKVIGLYRTREELYQRVDIRIEQMFEAGMVDEVKGLLEQGFSTDLPSMSAIGYRETALYLQGEISLEEAKARMRQKTRQFIRRQANWFKADNPLIEWHTMSPDSIAPIRESIEGWLHG